MDRPIDNVIFLEKSLLNITDVFFFAIQMRKYLDKEKKSMFKGSIFIQFTTLENAKAFMARESIKYGDTELIRKYRYFHIFLDSIENG